MKKKGTGCSIRGETERAGLASGREMAGRIGVDGRPKGKKAKKRSKKNKVAENNLSHSKKKETGTCPFATSINNDQTRGSRSERQNENSSKRGNVQKRGKRVSRHEYFIYSKSQKLQGPVIRQPTREQECRDIKLRVERGKTKMTEKKVLSKGHDHLSPS